MKHKPINNKLKRNRIWDFFIYPRIAMDLGTANTIIISDDKIVVDEPSVVALDRTNNKMIAVGEKAKLMYEKTHDY